MAHLKVGGAITKLKDAMAKTGSVSERERKLFAEIEGVESRYGPVALNIVSLALADKRDEAVGKMNANCLPLLAALIKASNEYIAYNTALANDEVKATEAAYAAHRNIMLLAGAVAVGLAFGLALLITRGLTRALGGEPAQLTQAAQRVASGDLGTVLGAQAAPAGSVLASLGDMQAKLAQVVGQVRSASDSMAIGSAQIASGNADLPQRTEQQAANLQQTAASMEEMNATVKNTADTARQATVLATSASAAAAKGGQVVGQVVATMDDITTSSRKIADIGPQSQGCQSQPGRCGGPGGCQPCRVGSLLGARWRALASGRRESAAPARPGPDRGPCAGPLEPRPGWTGR